VGKGQNSFNGSKKSWNGKKRGEQEELTMGIPEVAGWW
jgi:hypothetical protein